jgi:hypothetical protein
VPEARTVDTPNDINIRESQRLQRLAQGKALEGQKKTLDKPDWGPAFTFRFRQYKSTQFSGLWELAAMRLDGKVDEIITDADSLPEVLESIANIFANRGY